MRPAAAAAGVLAAAAAGMAVIAFAGDGDGGGAAEPVRERAPAPAGTDHPGLAVWIEHGCGSCHTLEAAASTGMFGPDLAFSLRGKPASYVQESIVAPAAAAAPGWEGDMMPPDYAARIPADDLEALVDFLVQSARTE